MWLTERDREIVELVFQAQALRDDQIQIALFSPGGASRCQRRLTLLVRHRYLDRLLRKAVNEPFVYLLSRRSIEGNRLLREYLGEEEVRRQWHRLGSIGHLLAVNDVRVRVARGCHDLGWSLPIWQRAEELSSLLAPVHLIPDAYFKVQRELNGVGRTAAFFLELERAGKSSRVLKAKLQRYADLYYGGGYQQLFGTKALRVLFVFTASDDAQPMRRVESAVEEAKHLGVTFARFASLDHLKSLPPASCLTDAAWYQAASPGAGALFDTPPTDRVALARGEES